MLNNRLNRLVFCGLIIIFMLITGCHSEGPAEEVVSLWPEIEPFDSGYLKVSDIHELYYELCGNNKGIPVLFIHGGPGGSSSPYMRRFCDPQKFFMILYDQRGAGKSKPYGELKENTTRHLVDDIEVIRKHVGVEKMILFGGSWGTTLALAYAEAYPQHVRGMILRGVFLATQKEIDHFYHGGVGVQYPDVYDALLSELPDPGKKPLPDYLYELISGGSEKEKETYSRAWARYEIKLSGLSMEDSLVDKIVENNDVYAFALFENYYMANGCFLEEGQLLKNSKAINQIQTVIVNGRYDVICPPQTAYELHRHLDNSTLIIAEGAGHWMGEPPVEKELIRAFRQFQ